MDYLSESVAAPPAARKTKRGFARGKPILFAVIALAGLVAVIWFVFRDQLVRAVPVQTGQIILLEQESNEPAATVSDTAEMLFQASGWVEPDPWPVNLAVKINGFVEEVFVKEGESVTNGQIVATLDPADAQLALDKANANVRKAEAALTTSRNAAAAVKQQTEVARFRVDSVVARLHAERDTWQRYSNTPSTVYSPNELVRAKQSVEEYEAEEKAAQAAVDALKAQTIQAESEAEVAAAALAAAVKEQEEAQLALDRTVIRSDMDGIVLRRYVKPGDKRMVGADDPNSAAIASIYDPAHLQVRVDVPIAEAGKMFAGQPTRIFSALLPGREHTGSVTRIVGQADLQRNTLQAKIRIDDPDILLRPDILCRVEFWQQATSGTEGKTAGRHTLWIPVSALQSEASEQDIWVVDPISKTASRRKVELAPTVRDELRQVVRGVRANELVILNSNGTLKEGTRVKEVNQ